MKTKIFIYLITAALISCSQRSKAVDLNKNKPSEFDVEYVVYDSPEGNRLKLDLIIHYPNSIFSFVKQDMRFYSKSNFYVNILNKETSELEKKSFKKELYNQKYFDCNNTKKINNYKLEYLLNEGEYEVTVIIMDHISKQKYKTTKDIIVKEFNRFSVPLLVERNKENNFINVKPENFNGDTLWAKVQIAANRNLEDLDGFIVTYENKVSADTLDFSMEACIYDETTKTIFFPLIGILNNQYNFLVMKFNEEIKKVEINGLGSKRLFWSSDIKELKGVMKYFLNQEEAEELDSLKNHEVKQYLKSYWITNYEDSDELLFELKTRFKYVNDNFSSKVDGWKSSRGEIYLIYGYPTSIESWSEYISSKGHYNEVKFEVWHYNEINKKFKFVKSSYFEDFVLSSM